MSKLLKLIMCSALILIAASSCDCYRMPTEEDYSLIPSTNNPDYTREKASASPGVGY